jgi:hypothetical protein
MNLTLFYRKYACFFLLIALAGLNNNTYAQSSKKVSRSALNLTGGFNTPQVSVPSNPGLSFTLGYQFVPLRPISVGAEVAFGTMSGKGPVKSINTEGVLHNVNHTFSTQYVSYEITGMINLQRLAIGTRAPKRWIPYITVGSGYMSVSASRENNVGQKTYDFTLYYNHVGGAFKNQSNARS